MAEVTIIITDEAETLCWPDCVGLNSFHLESKSEVVVLEHWAQRAFANTDLDAQLTQRGIEKIILVGFVVNTCIEGTAPFGVELGYHVTLIKDATAAFEPEGMQGGA